MTSFAFGRYFVWVSSTTKGPFLPAYAQGSWHGLLTQKLQGGVRLVGPTISCRPLIIDMAQAPIQHPHVQVASSGLFPYPCTPAVLAHSVFGPGELACFVTHLK